MPGAKPIVIVGGGLAGLTLGIGLRRRDVPVTIREAGRYPRHRVCGEFISGGGQDVLAQLELRSIFENAGAVRAKTAKFIAGANESPVRALPSSALCLSRFTMDAALANEFRRLGGDLKEDSRCNGPAGAEGVVHAAGRRAQTVERGWRWFGLKVHARDVPLAADLEMHISSAGYVGINRIDHDQVNVCGLFRARPGMERPDSARELLRGQPGSTLHERLAQARFDDGSFCAVAGLALQPRRAADSTECRIGDALTMIPPVTGNGMSMAFESAAIAVQPLAAYSCSEIGWPEARREIARACDAAFARRLRWARRLQWLMFFPLTRTRLGAVLFRSELVWRAFFARTR